MKFKLTLKFGPLRVDREIEAVDGADMERKVDQADAFLDIDMPDCCWRQLGVSWQPVPETKWFRGSK